MKGYRMGTPLRRRRVWLSAVFALGSLGAAPAFAQLQPPAFTTFQLNTWTVSPAIHDQHVKGFLAYADAGSIVGSNISVLWFQRETNGTWTTWAWPSYDLTDATLYVRGLFSDTSIFEQDPVLSEEAWGTVTGNQPKQVVNGLFFDDPVQPLIEAAIEPESLVSTLVEIGWQAAPDLSPLAVAEPVICAPGQAPKDPVKALMDELAYKAEMTLFNTSSVDLQCFGAPCPGCQRVYDGKTAAPGSHWVYHSRLLQADNRYLCFYDRDARQYWRESGLSYIFCNTCSGTGYIATTMHAQTTSPAGDSDCHPPAN